METPLDLSEFARYFMRDEGIQIKLKLSKAILTVRKSSLVLYTPYWINVLQAWEKRDHPNFLFLFYEDMQQVRFYFKKFLK